MHFFVQIVIGNFGLSVDQHRVQMAMFSMLASPLMMSNDLRSVPPESKQILLNRGVIAINQDPLGVQAKRIIHVSTLCCKKTEINTCILTDLKYLE